MFAHDHTLRCISMDGDEKHIVMLIKRGKKGGLDKAGEKATDNPDESISKNPRAGGK